jgi:hypothetical protein
MRRFLLTLSFSLLLLGGAAQAQALSDFFASACRSTTVLGDDFQWLCTAGQLIGNLEALVNSFHTEMGAFAQELFDTWFSDALRTLGANLPGGHIDAALRELQNAIHEGPVAFRAKVREVLDALRLSNRTAPRAPEGTPEGWLEQATRVNPNLAIGEARNEQRAAELATMNAEARAAHAVNEELARGMSEATASRDAMVAVLGMPALPGVPSPSPGTAAQLEEQARLANSTRTAIVYLSEGIANLMRQDAAFSGAIIEHLRVLSQQQVMTTWQLQHAVSALVREQERELARERARLQTRLAQQVELGRQMGEALSGVAQGVAGTLGADVSDLRDAFDALNGTP